MISSIVVASCKKKMDDKTLFAAVLLFVLFHLFWEIRYVGCRWRM